MKPVQKYLLHLLKCAVNNEKADNIPDNISLAQLFAYAKEEQVENLAYAALPPTDREPEIIHKFRKNYERAIVREAKQELELSMISETLTAAGIKHVPLKGSVVKYMYPSPDLRQSGDIDILTDTDKGIDNIMASLGFTADMIGVGKHDSYSRGKMHIEIHSALTNHSSVFENKIWDNVRQVSGKRYEMTYEFLYVYLLLHLQTHLLCGGAGIKLILDLYAFKLSIQADREKIDKFAEEAGVVNLMRYAETLISNWFDGIPYDDENIYMLEKLILYSPVYGSFENYIKMHYASSAKSKNTIKMIFLPYFFRDIIFLPYSRMIGQYPILKKMPVLLPVMWVHRIIKRLFAKDRHIQVITETLSSANGDDVDKYKAFRDNILK